METENKTIRSAIYLMEDLKKLEDFSQTIFDMRWECRINDNDLFVAFETKIKELEVLTDKAIEEQKKIIKQLISNTIN